MGYHNDPDAKRKTEAFEPIQPEDELAELRQGMSHIAVLLGLSADERVDEICNAAASLISMLVSADKEAAALRRQLAEMTELKGYFTLNGDRNLAPETKAALSDLARAVYMHHLETDNIALRRQLAECQEVRLAELALGTQSDAVLERAIAEAAELRRQLAEEKAQREQAQDSAAVAWAKAAASPALIEEYARACHYAGSSGLAIVDWSQWLSRRATRR